MEYDPTRQEARNQLYLRLINESGLNPKSRPGLLVAHLLKANIDKIVAELSCKELWGFYLVFSGFNNSLLSGIRLHLLEKCKSANDYVCCMDLCLPGSAELVTYRTGEMRQAADDVMERLAKHLQVTRAPFKRYEECLDVIKRKLYDKKVSLEYKHICHLYPSFLKAWASAITTESEFRGVLQCCQNMEDASMALRAWHKAVDPLADLSKLKSELLEEVQGNDHHNFYQYLAVLKYLYLDDEVRSGNYLLDDYLSKKAEAETIALS